MRTQQAVVVGVVVAAVGVLLIAAAYFFGLMFYENASRYGANCYFDCLRKCATVEFPSGRLPEGAPPFPTGPSCSDACKDVCRQN